MVFCGSEPIAKRGIETLSGKTLRLVTGDSTQDDDKGEEEAETDEMKSGTGEAKTDENKSEPSEETKPQRQFKEYAFSLLKLMLNVVLSSNVRRVHHDSHQSGLHSLSARMRETKCVSCVSNMVAH